MTTELKSISNETVIHEGYLQKQSLYLKKLRTRWMMLKGNCLYSFKTKLCNNQPTEIIHLKSFDYVTINNMNTFEIRSKDNKTSRIFVANSSSDMNKWVKSIQSIDGMNEIFSTTQYKFDKHNKNSHSIKIDVTTKEFLGDYSSDRFNDELLLQCSYSEEETMSGIFHDIMNYMKMKYYPLLFTMNHVNSNSFTGLVGGNGKSFKSIGQKSITDYDGTNIIKGLMIYFRIQYVQKIISDCITCKYMNKFDTKDIFRCPVYKSMMKKTEYTQDNLNHLRDFNHFLNEFEEKPICDKKDVCSVYMRQEYGVDDIADKCHMKLFRHPPRSRLVKLQDNVNSLIVNESAEENHRLYYPTEKDKDRYYQHQNGYLDALIEEVIQNGYKHDLCLECKQNDECKHEEYSVLKIVDEKRNCKRHRSIGGPLRSDHMLALILYTNGDCNYDLCASQRKKNYMKWKWFDLCLYHAIRILSESESGEFSVYSGLSGVKVNKREIECGYFVTYVSTSWRKEIAQMFMGGGDGMIIEFDTQFKNHPYIRCCDVSWISRFEDECEILFARSIGNSYTNFKCVIIDDADNIQTVKLQKRK